MLSLLMLLLTTMTAVTATSNNKQSAQTTVQFFLQLLTFFEQLFGNFLRNYGIWGGGGNLEQLVESSHDATPLTFDNKDVMM